MSRPTRRRSRFRGNRESGAVKTMVATKPSRANFRNPIIIHEAGGKKAKAGQKRATR